MIDVKFKKLVPKGIIPKKACNDDAAYDLFCPKGMLLESSWDQLGYETVPGESSWDEFGCVPTPVKLGFATEIPTGYYAKIEGKSGLASRGIFPVGGVIDAGYRGEWVVLMVNFGKKYEIFMEGDKIAQVTFHPVLPASFTEVDELNYNTERGTGGFGSTGQ
jgi:dUTP pyrophosphatase